MPRLMPKGEFYLETEKRGDLKRKMARLETEDANKMIRILEKGGVVK